MGKISRRNVLVIFVCLAITAVLVHKKSDSRAIRKKTSIREALSVFDAWSSGSFHTLDAKIVEALELDDYTNQVYSDGNHSVFLYIGYYLTTKKIGAAHDPLVCFPGQGWTLSGKETGEIILETTTGQSVSYTSFIAGKGQSREYILYWFQSDIQSSSDTISQKLRSFWNKIFRSGEENAFVRITTSLNDKSRDEAYRVVASFVEEFYPIFLKYVKEGNE